MDRTAQEGTIARPTTRRALLGGAAAGVAMLGVRAIAGPEVVKAASNPALFLNQENDSTADTVVSRNNGDTNLTLCGSDYGIIANCHVQNGFGIQGSADSPGGTGVIGRTSGASTGIAVHAIGNTENGEGYAVKAQTKNGCALYGEAVGGYALQTQGVTFFSRAGIVTMKKGVASRSVTLSGMGNYITGTSFVVATIQGDVAGTWVRACSVNLNANSFTLRLNRAAPKDLKVGWFVIN